MTFAEAWSSFRKAWIASSRHAIVLTPPSVSSVAARMSDFFSGLTNVTANIFYSTDWLRKDLQDADLLVPLQQSQSAAEALDSDVTQFDSGLGDALAMAQSSGWPSAKLRLVAGNVSELLDHVRFLRKSLRDLDSVERNIIEKVNIATVGTNAALGALRMAKMAAHQARVFVHETKLTTAGVLKNVATTSLAFFSTVFLAFVAGLVVMIAAVLPYLVPCKLPGALARYLFNCSWALTYTFMILMFLLASAFVLLTFVWTE